MQLLLTIFIFGSLQIWGQNLKEEPYFADATLVQAQDNKGQTQLLYQGSLDQWIWFNKIRLSEVPVSCLQSILATEDQDFLQHSGVDIKSLLRAAWVNLKSGRFAQGGSTLTQQYVKNAYLSKEKTLSRKWQELKLSLKIEKTLTKDEILERYLNVVYFGQEQGTQIRGLGAASQYYYNRQVSDLELGHCLTLAAMLKGPHQYHPVKKNQVLQKRRQFILKQMQDQQLITQSEANKALPLPALSAMLVTHSFAPFAYYLDAWKKLNPTLTQPSELNLNIDVNLQTTIQESAKKHLNQLTNSNPQKLEIALIVTERKSKKVKVIISGKDFQTSPFPRAVISKRPIGSLIKPWLYKLAIEQLDLNLDSTIPDDPIEITSVKPKWVPQNYDKKNQGPVTLKQALSQSLNLPTVYLGQTLGMDKWIESLTAVLPQINIKEWSHPSSWLGSSNLSVYDVTQLYLSFEHPLDNKPLLESSPSSPSPTSPPLETEATIPSSTLLIHQALIEAGRNGTSKALAKSEFYPAIYGKTGTSSDYRDSWFAGWTPDYLVVIWIGRDNNESAHLTGSQGALPLFIDIAKILSNSSLQK